MEFPLDHIGIAVRSINEALPFYQALGFTLGHIEEVPSEQVRVGFLPLPNGGNIELLEATSQNSPVSRFIDKRGPGVHHLCFQVKDLQAGLGGIENRGMRLVNETAQKGAHGCLVAFIHPSSAGGVLVELSQKEVDSSGVKHAE